VGLADKDDVVAVAVATAPKSSADKAAISDFLNLSALPLSRNGVEDMGLDWKLYAWLLD